MKQGRVINLPDSPKHIFEDAISMGAEYHIDEKGTPDNPGIWQRQTSKLTFDEAFDLIQPYKPHWVCIFRNESYITNRPDDDHWDLGGCNIASNGYGDVFIWIRLTPNIAEQLFVKYNLITEWYG